MASEWGPRGITANSISPGPVWTELGKRAWSERGVREGYQASVPTGEFCSTFLLLLIEMASWGGVGWSLGIEICADLW
jgi:NAD(P)-dependent dehydrogenase (short-subunit alcohol dehydrogenase family)